MEVFTGTLRHYHSTGSYIDFSLITLAGDPIDFRMRFTMPQAKSNFGIIRRLCTAFSESTNETYVTIQGEKRSAGRSWEAPAYRAKRIIINGATFENMPAGS